MGIGGIPTPLPSDLASDLSAADPETKATAQKAAQVARDLGLPSAAAAALGANVGGWMHGFRVVFAELIALLLGAATDLVVYFLKQLTDFRKKTIPEQVDISAAVLSEFLATEIDPKHVQTGKSIDATIEAARVIGGALHDRLITEFAPNGEINGERAARVFSGYAVNFAVQNTMISTIADALSFHLLENFRELGVETARNLGLGRLQRDALRPLIRNLIAQPYEKQLRKRYRQDQLDPKQLVTAYFAGRRTRDDVNDALAEHGLRDADIEELLQQLPPDLNQTEIVRLMRYGEMTQDEVVSMLRSMGWPEDLARRRVRSSLLARVDDNWQAYVSLITKQRVDGLLEEDEFNKLLERAPFTDEEKQLVRDFVGQSLEVPRAHLSWTEVKTAFEEGVLDMDYVDRWLEREGFSDEDALTREYLLLLDLDRKTEKAQVAAEKAARKAAASGQPPPTS